MGNLFNVRSLGAVKIKKTTIRTGVVQFDVLKGQGRANLDKVFTNLANLARQGVELAVLPEMFTCSFDNESLMEHASEADDILSELSDFARDNRMAIAGSLPENNECGLFNTFVFIDTDGIIKGKYQKIHLFRLTGEDEYYAPGSSIVSMETSLGRIGMMICYDLRFPELARHMFLDNVHMILVCAQWPEPRKEQWKTLARARAIENQLFVICSNRTGIEDSLAFPGMSMIIDPLGNIIADAGFEEGFAIADMTRELIHETRSKIPCMTDRRSDVYG